MDKIIPIPHGMFDGLQGQNYELDGAISFALEAMGEKEYDYWFVAGLTGDSFNQIYYRDRWRGNSAAEVRLSDGDMSPVLETFAMCGYDCEFVPSGKLLENRDLYMDRIMRSIDRGIPVIGHIDGWQMIVGYSEESRAMLALWGDRWGDTWTTPGRIEPGALFVPSDAGDAIDKCPNPGMFFPGEKRDQVDLAGLYRMAIQRLPGLLTLRSDDYCFGAEAFRAWADEIEGGKYDGIGSRDFEKNKWYYYTNYVCVMASNGSGYRPFLDRALSLNPDMGFLPRMCQLFSQMGRIWEGPTPDKESLEELGGGFNITLETLKSRERRSPIVARLRECAALSDELVSLPGAR